MATNKTETAEIIAELAELYPGAFSTDPSLVRLAATEALDLPMSRQDIADHLGLTIETVSRTMSQLVSEASVGLRSSRRIVLRNRGALRQLNS
jgi:CRP-like cAMP-binding protein